jgi:hypothetical protein
MTIASHCIDLLRANGPMSAADLGEACRSAGVSAAKNPALSVAGAIGGHADGRVVRIGDQFHLATALLDGRWLTLAAPTDDRAFEPGFDLYCLVGVAERDGIPLATGGRLRGSRHGMWSGPRGWAPDGELVGLRLSGGTAEIAAVSLNDTAAERGDQLAERVLAGAPRAYRWGLDRPDRLAHSLFALLHLDDGLLREPVAPLHTLLPAEPPNRAESEPVLRRSAGPHDVHLRLLLPPEVYGGLSDAAALDGTPVEDWVAAELRRLAAWPAAPYASRHDDTYDDELALSGEWQTSPVLRLDRFR